MLTYGEVSATPFGDLEVSDIRIADPDGDESLTITIGQSAGDIRTEDNGLSWSYKSAMTDAVLPIDAFEKMNQSSQISYHGLTEMGYQTLSGDGLVEASYDHDSGDFTSSMAFDFDDFLSLELNLKLSETNLERVRDLAKLRELPLEERQEKVKLILAQMALQNAASKRVSASIKTNAQPFFKRLSANDGDRDQVERKLDRLLKPYSFLALGQSEQQAQESIAAVKTMLFTGKPLLMQTNIKQPQLFYRSVNRTGWIPICRS